MHDTPFIKLTSHESYHPKIRRKLRIRQKHPSIVRYGVSLEEMVPGQPHRDRWS